MLTVDHIEARKKGDELVLRSLDKKARDEALTLASAYLETARDHVGSRRCELNEAWQPFETAARQRKLALGLKKLVDDACAFDADETLDPVALRRTLFLKASEVRRAGGFKRDDVLAEVAETLGKTPSELESALFSDLRGEHVLRAAPTMNAASLVEAYELGRAQAVLLRAVRVTCEVESASPGPLRSFFSCLKFHGLLFTVSRTSETKFTLVIDGPFSMFESVTKYGLRLALVLPALRALETWTLTAEVRWGKDRESLVFRMASTDVSNAIAIKPAAQDRPQAHITTEVQSLLDSFEAMPAQTSRWNAEIATVVLDHPGLGVCVPDLVLRPRDRKNGEPVYVEVLGFWSRDAVWRRVELAQQGLGARIVFCASSRLRVSPQVIDEKTPAALYVFKGKPSARALLACVEQLGTSAE